MYVMKMRMIPVDRGSRGRALKAVVGATRAELAAAQQRTDGVPIRRAMENLRSVLTYRLERNDVRSETLHEVAAILDEAARKIERL